MPPLLAIFIVTTIDLMGFGVLVPLVPYMADRYGAGPWLVTAILASYSLCQLVTAPLWGRLSDRYGRRPILAASLAGACLSYVMLGFAPSLGWLLAARMLNGAMAGNISAAMAYASDVSAPAERARAMGVVGAAIGVGFTIGPALGGALAGDSVQGADFLRPALVSAAFSLLAIGIVVFVLRESLDARTRIAQREAEGHGTILGVLRERPVLGWVVLSWGLVTFSQASLESVFALWALQRFGLGPRSIGYLLFGLAVIAVTLQGGLVRRLVRALGEWRLALWGVAIYVAGLACAGLAPGFGVALCGLALCGIGSGLFPPVASALASRQSDAGNRGVVMGSYQSGGSLARVIGPLAAGYVFSRYGAGAPYLLGALVTAQAAWCLLAARRQAEAADMPAGAGAQPASLD